MLTIFKNLYRYIKNISAGEESIMDRDKINITLFFIMSIHLVSSVFLGLLGNIVLCLFHVVVALVYLAMSGIHNEQKNIFVSAISCGEIMISVILFCLTIGRETGGNLMGYNLYCIAVIPAIFYISSSVKNFPKPTLVSSIVTLVALLTFSFTVVYSNCIHIEPVKNNTTLFIIISIFNSVSAILSMFVYSTLNSWERKNSTEMLTRRNEQLSLLSNRDPLTKLANRRSMMEKLNVAMSMLRNQNKQFCVILGDIDDFKKINDNYGHDCGDKVLVTVANIIMGDIRESDVACRWGGEEILIMVEGAIGPTDTIARRIWDDIAHAEIIHDGIRVPVTMTFGVAEAAINYRLEDLIQQADNKLYYGKGHGKNQVVVSLPKSY